MGKFLAVLILSTLASTAAIAATKNGFNIDNALVLLREIRQGAPGEAAYRHSICQKLYRLRKLTTSVMRTGCWE